MITPTVPSLVDDDTQDELRGTLRRMLGEHSSHSRLLAFVATPEIGLDGPL